MDPDPDPYPPNPDVKGFEKGDIISSVQSNTENSFLENLNDVTEKPFYF